MEADNMELYVAIVIGVALLIVRACSAIADAAGLGTAAERKAAMDAERRRVPDGFSLNDKVTFDQLPEQIRDFHKSYPSAESSLWLNETHAVLTFFLSESGPWTHRWEKTPSGWVDLTK